MYRSKDSGTSGVDLLDITMVILDRLQVDDVHDRRHIGYIRIYQGLLKTNSWNLE